MTLRNKIDESEMEYKPGEIVRSGNKTYQADAWGVLVPQAKNAAYLRRKAKMIAALKEDARNGKI